MQLSASVCVVTNKRAVSLAALTVLEVSPPQMIEIAARCGYSHVGLRPIPATPDEVHFPLMADKALERETLATLRAYDIGVLDIEILRLKPDTRVLEFEAVLEFGAQCGARFALVAGNDPDASRLADNFAHLGDLARPFGLRPHIEFMPWTNVQDLGAAMNLAKTCRSDNVGVLIDAFHLNRSGSLVEDIPFDDPVFGYTQLCDISGPIPNDLDEILFQARAARLFPGQGDCPLLAILQRLPPNTPISLEVPADALRDHGMTAHARALAAIHGLSAILGNA
jgi:sugar phosphate isomerase/epimerase